MTAIGVDLGRWAADGVQRFERFRGAFAEALFREIIDGGQYSPGTPVADGSTKQGWARADAEDLATLHHPRFHVLLLESGLSGQAPQGFIRLAVDAAPAIAQTVLAQMPAGGPRG
jgi:hypothetical protein